MVRFVLLAILLSGCKLFEPTVAPPVATGKILTSTLGPWLDTGKIYPLIVTLYGEPAAFLGSEKSGVLEINSSALETARQEVTLEAFPKSKTFSIQIKQPARGALEIVLRSDGLATFAQPIPFSANPPDKILDVFESRGKCLVTLNPQKVPSAFAAEIGKTDLGLFTSQDQLVLPCQTTLTLTEIDENGVETARKTSYHIP